MAEGISEQDCGLVGVGDRSGLIPFLESGFLECATGISRRDYFAATALAAIINIGTWPSAEADVKQAYHYADLMIKESNLGNS